MRRQIAEFERNLAVNLDKFKRLVRVANVRSKRCDCADLAMGAWV
jgi:hypothetical protein